MGLTEQRRDSSNSCVYRLWICQRLQELRICFLFREAEQDLLQKVFGHLSTLIQLEHLRIVLPDNESFEHEEEVLEFRLEYGLGQLLSLR
jgi:hypothetical protein